MVSQTIGPPGLVLALNSQPWFQRLGWGGVLLYLGVVVLVAAGLGLVVWIGKALRGENPDRIPEHDLLAHFRELHGRGLLSDGEYQRIKAKLSEKIRRQLDSPGEPSREPSVPKDHPRPRRADP